MTQFVLCAGNRRYCAPHHHQRSPPLPSQRHPSRSAPALTQRIPGPADAPAPVVATVGDIILFFDELHTVVMRNLRN